MINPDREGLTLAITSDAYCPDVCLDSVETAVQLIRSHLGRTALISNHTEPITLPGNEKTDTINARSFQLPDVTTDMTVMVTNRKIVDGNKGVLGFAWTDAESNQPIGSRFAVVSLNRNSPRHIKTAAHEVGHLFNLKYNGRDRDGTGHCVDTACTMYPYDKPDCESDFCGECSRQLRVNASYLTEAKAGATLPYSLIYAPIVGTLGNKVTEVTNRSLHI